MRHRYAHPGDSAGGFGESAMAIYQAEKKSSVMFLGMISLLIGSLFAAIGIGSIVSDLVAGKLVQHSSNITALFCGAIGGAAAYLGWLYVWRRVCEVRLPGDGSVELVGAFRQSKIAGSDLLELERSTAKIGFEDGDARELRVRSRRGTMLVPYFDDIEQLVGDIQAQNPHIAVTGAWPTAG
jgi:hypothetical protein